MIDRGRRVLEQSLHVRHSQCAMASGSLGPEGAGNSPIPRTLRPATGMLSGNGKSSPPISIARHGSAGSGCSFNDRRATLNKFPGRLWSPTGSPGADRLLRGGSNPAETDQRNTEGRPATSSRFRPSALR